MSTTGLQDLCHKVVFHHNNKKCTIMLQWQNIKFISHVQLLQQLKYKYSNGTALLQNSQTGPELTTRVSFIAAVL